MIQREFCKCCGKKSHWQTVNSLPRFLFGHATKIVECSECGVGRTLPAPNTGEVFYENNSRYNDLFTDKADLYREFARGLLNSLNGLINPEGKHLLDVATGGGFLVEIAGERGYNAEGMEANAEMVQWCNARKLNVWQADVENLEGKIGNDHLYDVIVLSAILEHLPLPGSLLQNCKKKLKPDGVILLSQASFDGLLPRLFPWVWYGWQPREHFWHFTPNSVRALADRSGLKTIHTVRNSLYHPWFLKGTIKDLVGRNIAACIAKLGTKIGQGDSFNMVLSIQ